jgi:hypothetical protein
LVARLPQRHRRHCVVGIGHIFITAFLRYSSAMGLATCGLPGCLVAHRLVGWYFVVYRGAGTTGEGDDHPLIALPYAPRCWRRRPDCDGAALADAGSCPGPRRGSLPARATSSWPGTCLRPELRPSATLFDPWPGVCHRLLIACLRLKIERDTDTQIQICEICAIWWFHSAINYTSYKENAMTDERDALSPTRNDEAQTAAYVRTTGPRPRRALYGARRASMGELGLAAGVNDLMQGLTCWLRPEDITTISAIAHAPTKKTWR